MRDLPVILLIFMSAAAPGLADCPTAEALAKGRAAYAVYPDGSIVALRRLGDGRMQETTRYADGGAEFRMISAGGVFIVDEVDLAGDREYRESRITTTYQVDLSAHLPLAPDQSFSLDAVNSFADGTPPEKEHIEVKTGGIAEVDVASCQYRGFPMLLTYRWGSEHFTSMMTHLPELGLSLELARMDQGQQPEPFAPVRFSLDPP